MTKTNEKIHVLVDEKLGGIKREYMEIDRKAEVGEKVIITRKLDCYMLDMKIGSIYEVVRLVEGSHGDVNVIDDTDEEATASFGGYRVLVPVDKHEKIHKNKNSGYKEMKNLIHNELGITRQDIQEMISAAVSNEVQKMFESGKLDSIVGGKIESLIEEGFTDGGRLLYGFKERVSQTVSDEVGKRIANVLNIKVEVRGDH